MSNGTTYTVMTDLCPYYIVVRHLNFIFFLFMVLVASQASLTVVKTHAVPRAVRLKGRRCVFDQI